jgi:pyrimidine oxygenase
MMSVHSPQSRPSFQRNRTIAEQADVYTFNLDLSMVKLQSFWGRTAFWDHNLESFTLMAGLAAVSKHIKRCTSVVLPTLVARMASTIDDISHGQVGINIVTGWNWSEGARRNR